MMRNHADLMFVLVGIGDFMRSNGLWDSRHGFLNTINWYVITT